ncbi:PREDICTED: uncharacterized protein LOC108564934 [Nicrophorus vespilloides]|uniref:Uncharacterized protein LOC108564934 n=1 Tax=Nicrophorus vespilloides TaxID=110193 RepID=A0ABM1MYH4_NICVS|nr:PREDICTED: uncharacterized protein LOC108564934 [Nicrophorus vespilloides]
MKCLQVFATVLILVSLVKCQGNRYIEKQLLCALDEAPCDAWGQQIKAALPEIIGRGCQNCDRVQLNNVKRITRFVQSRYPEIWASLVDKYSNYQ